VGERAADITGYQPTFVPIISRSRKKMWLKVNLQIPLKTKDHYSLHCSKKNRNQKSDSVFDPSLPPCLVSDLV